MAKAGPPPRRSRRLTQAIPATDVFQEPGAGGILHDSIGTRAHEPTTLVNDLQHYMRGKLDGKYWASADEAYSATACNDDPYLTNYDWTDYTANGIPEPDEIYLTCGDPVPDEVSLCDVSTTGNAPATAPPPTATLGRDLREPRSYHEVVTKSPQREHWIAANDKELASQKKNGTFEVIEKSSLPAGANVIDGVWRYKLKIDPDTGLVKRYKARLCARGDKQRAGIDYFDTSSPVVAYSTLRTIPALAAINDWNIDGYDVETAYLNATLEEEVFMRVPPGMLLPGNKLLRIRKGLYGLCQAGRAWWLNFNTWLTSHDDCTRCSTDSCVYYFTRGNGDTRRGEFVILMLYVDAGELY